MPLNRLNLVLQQAVAALETEGRRKGHEAVVVGVLPPQGEKGPRYLLEGYGDQPFIRMNSNSYLGLSRHPALKQAEEEALERFGVGPGAVRFISGTYKAHVELELDLARFHGREAAMIFSSAYATVLSVVVPLTTDQTVLISDELNHNCIINAVRLARPLEKIVYKHLNLGSLEQALQKAIEIGARRALVITDGVFSMRGSHAPLAEMSALVQQYDSQFAENALLVVDDSHGVGAFGPTGRGTEEYTATRADILVGTLGKAFGVNGGYVLGPSNLIAYLRETSLMYIYSNPITPGEAAAARAALKLLQAPEGQERLRHLQAMTQRFRQGLLSLGYESFPGAHPVVPLVLRDGALTNRLVRYLRERGVLATAIVYPVVPKGEDSIRFQVSAEHTQADIDEVLGILQAFKQNVSGPS
ncbi:aminotransferase class I/II-fold pyridoxal phosphate-dependent enzyme [Meiothermus hypogaeus]|uniref:2-amino-3-ketobutyrate coenzyme A ligase n=2 Tax=Meiothermus hypogaeus TaxID=884155 RepID=A0A511R151_9DEIN|nr:aminotransferase class I/II-fold pyridoxal phosphate-dependent enzyme [Meiothermus hypogaeus]RIH79433.1 2-amino-3-ketobutyrate coenzyme A ligase [Meiothermus hypogaeus]GEM82746.1 2-amino-3-ketobutyrate coenzyme A ligase [Meiothermus hypogaeus NBRC 106114]